MRVHVYTTSRLKLETVNCTYLPGNFGTLREKIDLFFAASILYWRNLTLIKIKLTVDNKVSKNSFKTLTETQTA